MSVNVLKVTMNSENALTFWLFYFILLCLLFFPTFAFLIYIFVGHTTLNEHEDEPQISNTNIPSPILSFPFSLFPLKYRKNTQKNQQKKLVHMFIMLLARQKAATEWHFFLSLFLLFSICFCPLLLSFLTPTKKMFYPPKMGETKR